MSSIILPSKTKPMAGARLNYGHPGLSQGLVGCWLFNEGGGNLVNDLSGNSHLATLVGNAYLGPGIYGSTLVLDGTGDYATAGVIPFLSVWTLVCWFRWRGSASGYYEILTRGGIFEDDTNYALFLRNAATTFEFGVWANAAGTNRYAFHREATAWTPHDGKWHCGAALWNGTAFSLYLDGLPLTITHQSVGVGADGGQNTYIGHALSGSDLDWLGDIDLTMIYGRSLSDRAIAALYYDPFAMFRREPIEIWSAISGAGGQIESLQGQSNLALLTLGSLLRQRTILGQSDIVFLDSGSLTIPVQDYTMEALDVLPSDDGDLSIEFSEANYASVSTDDGDRVDAPAADKYCCKLFRDKFTGQSSLNITWNGQTNVAPNQSTVYLQIYNRTTLNWETIASNNVAGADVDFTLSASVTSDLEDYFDAGLWIACRVFQEALFV